MREVRLALILSWIVATVVTMATVLAPYALSTEQIARITPRCERKSTSGRECLLCGMTTGFMEIARGEFRPAQHSNRGALPLYGLFVCNGLGLPVTLLRAHRKRAKTC